MAWERMVAVVALGAFMAPGFAQRPVSADTHQLYRDWEQYQVNLIKEPTATLEPSAGVLQIFVFRAAGRPCSAYRAKLLGASKPLQERLFEPLGDSCSVRLETPTELQSALAVSAVDGQGTPLIKTEVAPSTREIAISLQAGLFRQGVEISHWPLRSDSSWWRDAVDWLPGFEFGGIPDRVQRLERPLWRVVRETCDRQEKSSEIFRALFSLLKTVEVTDYTVEEMRVLSACAITHGWGDTAQRAIDHWEALGGITQELIAARLRLAALQFRVGDYGAVSELSISTSRPFEEMQYRHLKSTALMALSRYTEAAELLMGIGSVGRTSVKTSSLGLYMRYNLATALLATGEQERAWAVLDALGQTEAADRTTQSLVDRANLVLGWQFLNAGSAATATPIFERVSLDSPYIPQALLGAGWSWFSERGETQRRVAEPTGYPPIAQSTAVLKALYQHGKISCEEYRQAMGDDAVCLRPARFRRQDERSDERRQVTAAQYWLRLLQVEMSDPAIIEAAIALSDAAASKGHLEAAKTLLHRCIRSVENQVRELSGSASTGPSENANPPATLQLWSLESEPHLLRSMLSTLAETSVEAGRSPGLRRQQRELRERAQKQLDRLFEKQRAKLQNQLNSYLIDARYKYARMLDLSRGAAPS